MNIGRKHTSLSKRIVPLGVAVATLLLSACAGPESANDAPSPGALRPITIAPAPVQDPPLTDRQHRLLSIFEASLTNPAEVDPSIRINAAEELILMRISQAMSVLDQALRSGRSPVVLAVVVAMDHQDRPIPELLEPAIAALTNVPPEVLEALSFVLTRYGDDALGPITELALDLDLPIEQRLGPIHTLGAFRSRDSAARLIELLLQPADEGGHIHAASCAALANLTGLRYGTNVQAWTRWWIQARDQTPEQWLEEMVASLQSQNANLNDDNAVLRSELDQANDRLGQAYLDLYIHLSAEERLAQLPTWLEDPLVSIRLFAIDRIERLRRDAASIPSDLQDALALRLGDEDPRIRKQSADLLDSLGYAGIADRVASSLAGETDPDVLSSYLIILSARISSLALEPLCQRLQDDQYSAAVADALWTLFGSEHGTPEAMARVRVILRVKLTTQQNPSLIRLMAFIGEDTDRAAFESALDGDDQDLRRAIAEGYARGGYRQPLMDRRGDEVIYPYALQAVERTAQDFERVRQLAILRPSSDNIPLWESAITRNVNGLQPSDILTVDDVLLQCDYATPTLRSNLLGRIAMLPADQLSPSQRLPIVERWTRILLDLGEWQRAHEVLDTIPDLAPDSPLRTLKFRAAMLTGNYEIALAIDSAPNAWIAFLAEIAPDHLEAAVRLRDEITRRFNGQLVGDLKVAFDTAVQNLPPADQTPQTEDGAGTAAGGPSL